MNFHSRSIRFRLGEYGGRDNNVIPDRVADPCATALG